MSKRSITIFVYTYQMVFHHAVITAANLYDKKIEMGQCIYHSRHAYKAYCLAYKHFVYLVIRLVYHGIKVLLSK